MDKNYLNFVLFLIHPSGKVRYAYSKLYSKIKEELQMSEVGGVGGVGGYGGFTSTTAILVLFILLVIISKAFVI
ncbi:hypothetical protein HPT30_28765 [Paenibacillus sp. JW14]|uniref:Sporulation protein YjcZ n=1 Tax=Paenibacillus agri TaxID=2744309 RepID=A0A850ET43_9BACL|nr:hypothetical protein [Paenibacillus agri]